MIHKNKFLLPLSGIAIGLAYGLAVRLCAQYTSFGVMSLGFLVVAPFAMGYVSVYVAERRERQPIWVWILVPWIPVILGAIGTILVLWEGWICVVMFTPIGLCFATLGGAVGGLSARRLRLRAARTSLVCVLILPLLIAPWEQQVFSQRELRQVETFIDIQAPPAVVWRNIERVPAIRPQELTPSWSRRIGFPDPVEATLSYEGVGGIRHATFAGGVLFIETIDVWEPQQRLAFSIQAQTDQIPPTTLDSHVRVGGAFFDVLRGEYRLEALPGGITRLHLSSRHRVSTDFNWYAHLWTDAIMADLQNTILHVIKRRCE
ncbi:MAG TPA: hypothetical protein VEW69_12140 [Alphaproteobacteria bacterium]|nr:hypothetical protein [Alphaproteobacteria bacterium]